MYTKNKCVILFQRKMKNLAKIKFLNNKISSSLKCFLIFLYMCNVCIHVYTCKALYQNICSYICHHALLISPTTIPGHRIISTIHYLFNELRRQMIPQCEQLLKTKAFLAAYTPQNCLAQISALIMFSNFVLTFNSYSKQPNTFVWRMINNFNLLD